MIILRLMKLLLVCLFYCYSILLFASVDTIKINEHPTQLEILVVDQFKQFCINNVNDFSKSQNIAQILGFIEEKNEYLPNMLQDKRWMIYNDNKSLTRINLILNNTSCVISAITSEKNIIQQGMSQTPIEHYLMNVLASELVKRQQIGEKEIRIFDANFRGKTATITLTTEIFPSKVKNGIYYYQIVLTLLPY